MLSISSICRLLITIITRYLRMCGLVRPLVSSRPRCCLRLNYFIPVAIPLARILVPSLVIIPRFERSLLRYIGRLFCKMLAMLKRLISNYFSLSKCIQNRIYLAQMHYCKHWKIGNLKKIHGKYFILYKPVFIKNL